MKIKVFSGNANRPLAEEICHHLGIEIGKAQVGRFSDGEFNFQILENVRGEDCFIVQPTCPPVDQNLMELLIMLDAFRRSSAKRITAVTLFADERLNASSMISSSIRFESTGGQVG